MSRTASPNRSGQPRFWLEPVGYGLSRKSGPLRTLSLALLTAGLMLPFLSTLAQTQSKLLDEQASPAKSPAQISQAYGQLLLTFALSQNESESQVEFQSKGRGYTFLLTSQQIIMSLSRPSSDVEVVKGKTYPDAKNSVDVNTLTPRLNSDTTSNLSMTWLGGNPNPTLHGTELQQGTTNYLLGNDPTRWRTGISNFARVEYQEVYPGIGLTFYGNQQHLEYDFIVKPGANPDSIRLGFNGVSGLELNQTGDLLLHTLSGGVTQQAPLLYQLVNGLKQKVPGHFKLLPLEPGQIIPAVGFEVGTYDTSQTLIIDPTLVYSTYLGGNSDDEGIGIAVNGSGSIFITGQTGGANFPTLAAFQPAFGGGQNDAFVTRLNSNGTLAYSTYFGGNDYDSGYDIAVDNNGNASISGYTASSNFPTKNAQQSAYGGGGDAFLARFNSNGTLAYSSYLGGNAQDYGSGLAQDSNGNLFMSGSTYSANFPTLNALQPVYAGGRDAFVTRFNPNGGLVYSTYLGGSGAENGGRIAVDNNQNAFVTGSTDSLNFPTLNPIQSGFSGFGNAFVTRLNSNGTLAYSTYLGGNKYTDGDSIAVDSNSNAYVTGTTDSLNFPTLNAFQPAFSGGYEDAFVTRFNPNGTLSYSTYLGGNGGNRGFGIAVDGSGNAVVTGNTDSTSFPTLNALQKENAGGADVIVVRFNPNGGLVYSTYLGGSGNESANDVVFDSSGNAYVTGFTISLNFPIENSYQSSLKGNVDGFVVKIGAESTPVEPVKQPPADLIGQLRQSPDRVASSDAENLIRYTFKVKNIGQGQASSIKVNFPVDAQLVTGFTEFTDKRVWVSSLSSTAIQVSLPELSYNEVVSGTLVFRPNPDPVPAAGSKVFTRYTLGWSDPSGANQQVMSNATNFSYGLAGSNQDVSGGLIQLMTHILVSSSTTKVVYHSNFWIPDEAVSIWLTRPDGTSIALVGGKANEKGEFDLTVDTTGLGAGIYVVAAYGQRSELYGSGLLEVGTNGSVSQAKAADDLRLKVLGEKEKPVKVNLVPNFKP